MKIKRYKIRAAIVHVLAGEMESHDSDVDDDGELIESGFFKVRMGSGQILYFHPFTFKELFEEDKK